MAQARAPPGTIGATTLLPERRGQIEAACEPRGGKPEDGSGGDGDDDGKRQHAPADGYVIEARRGRWSQWKSGKIRATGAAFTASPLPLLKRTPFYSQGGFARLKLASCSALSHMFSPQMAVFASFGSGCKIRKAILDEGVTIPDGQHIGYDPKMRFHVTDSGIVVF